MECIVISNLVVLKWQHGWCFPFALQFTKCLPLSCDEKWFQKGKGGYSLKGSGDCQRAMAPPSRWRSQVDGPGVQAGQPSQTVSLPGSALELSSYILSPMGTALGWGFICSAGIPISLLVRKSFFPLWNSSTSIHGDSGGLSAIGPHFYHAPYLGSIRARLVIIKCV